MPSGPVCTLTGVPDELAGDVNTVFQTTARFSALCGALHGRRGATFPARRGEKMAPEINRKEAAIKTKDPLRLCHGTASVTKSAKKTALNS
jgi:hypothetical protein